MPAFSSSAPGKIILFGEHAVVYGRPAIAVPVTQVAAKAIINADPRAPQGTVTIQAPDIDLECTLTDLPQHHPLAAAIIGTAATLGASRIPACTVRITSTIPVAAGLGSGAAVSVAVIRAVAAYLGRPLDDKQVSALAYEVEKIYHGTPSGIDNTVIAYSCPVYFVKGQTLQRLRVGRPFTIVIGDTGVASPTAMAVGDVRKAWQKSKGGYEVLFDSVSSITASARQAIETGKIEQLGPLMDNNHDLLQKIGVSCRELDWLVEAARRAGALGAKLSGGGRGGNMIALVAAGRASQLASALRSAGAIRTIVTEVK